MKSMVKKVFTTVMAMALFAGCSSGREDKFPQEEQGGFKSEITVVSREDGSGTRGAFIEICGIEEKNEAGEKVDKTIDEAEIANSTAIVMTTVSGDESAIGYISLGSLNDTVKAIDINGVKATAENVKNGKYTIARPFNLVKGTKSSPAADEFIKFILSSEGQAVVEKMGYVSVVDGSSYIAEPVSEKVTVSGSSSVAPVMEKLKEAYMEINAGAEVEISQSDSTTGMNSAIDGICDIGMASRSLKDSEITAGLSPTSIAIDGIAVIINRENPKTTMTKEQIKEIYTGGTTNWGEIE